jgi:hypothetical protein
MVASEYRQPQARQDAVASLLHNRLLVEGHRSLQGLVRDYGLEQGRNGEQAVRTRFRRVRKRMASWLQAQAADGVIEKSKADEFMYVLEGLALADNVREAE